MKSYHKIKPREHHYGVHSRSSCNYLIRKGIPYELIQPLVEENLPAVGDDVVVHAGGDSWRAKVVNLFQKEDTTLWLTVKANLYGVREVELGRCGLNRHHEFGQVWDDYLIEIVGNVFSHKQMQTGLKNLE